MSKKVVGYIRISKKDQSTYSLEGQADTITSHCERRGWELLDIFKEDGQSAKNFDRANWKELERYLKQHYKEIDYLVVAKYDRFSRNVAEAINKMEELERKYSIRIMSVMEDIPMHPDSPVFFQFRTQILMNAELELRILRDRTTFGLWQAAKNGYFVNYAPYGYKNNKTKDKKSLLIKQEEQAVLVREAYELLVYSGLTPAEIGRTLRKKGLPHKGNGAIQRMLKNPLYAGMVLVPKYYDNPEELVDGKHEAIIDRKLWWAAQGLLGGKTYNRNVYNEDVPLRGELKCQCHRCLTAGKSKGRTKYYWYYRCINTGCPSHNKNLNANKLHAQFDDLMKELSLPAGYLELLQKKAAAILDAQLKERSDKVKKLQQEISELEGQILSLEGKFIRDEIKVETYKKWLTKLENDKYSLEDMLSGFTTPLEHIHKQFKTELTRLSDLSRIYHAADIHQKQAFIKLVFKSELYYSDGAFRTRYLMPLFMLNAASLKEKRLLYVEQPLRNDPKVLIGSEEEI